MRITKKRVILARRIARVVEWTGLENRRTSRYRRFESYILRQKKASQMRGFFCLKLSDHELDIRNISLEFRNHTVDVSIKNESSINLFENIALISSENQYI